VRATLIPFAIQVLLFLTTLAVQTVALIRIWKNRVDIVNELDRQKDELLSIVSHQLATPITSIKWYLEMMMNGDLGALSDQMKEHVHSMQGIAINLVDLVGMILDVSRIQLGRMKVEKQKMDLDGFFKKLIEVIEPRAIEKKVKFSKEIPASMPSAMLDKRYTRMTIENLLSNAVKYTPENGEVQLKVKVQNDKLYCEVSDTGMGIPKAEQDKIFGKLFRASNVRNSVDGNGFGLYVAKGAVESQGGAIRFTSTEGKGTTFYVELPLKD
jgi:signal transduction histidine kinase